MSSPVNKYSDTQVLLIIAPLVALFALSLDFYIPIVPHLRQLYNIDHDTMQLTLSGFMFCCGVSQIIVGPLCDRFGRRTIALFSLVIFILGCLLSLHIPTFTHLIIARLLQAFGASGTFLSAYTTIRDLYPSITKSTKMYSLVNVCISQSPIFAPAIGGILAQTYHWKAVFICLLLTGLVTLLSTYLFYQETAPVTHPIHLNHLKKAYGLILPNRNFQVYSLAASIGMGSFFMFFSQSPYIIIDLLHYSKFEYGIFFGIVGFSFFVSSLLTNSLDELIGNHNTVTLGTGLMSIGGIGLILSEHYCGITISGFIIPMTLVVSGAALAIGAGLSGTMQPFGNIAGTAFSAIGFCKFMSSAILGLILLKLDIAPYVLGTIIASLATFCLSLCFIFRTTLLKNGETPIIIPTEYD